LMNVLRVALIVVGVLLGGQVTIPKLIGLATRL